MDTFRKANFPMSMLDESSIAPRRTLPGSPDEAGLKHSPVFLLQATFITGGLLLTLVSQSSTMDMIGQSQVMNLLAKACRKEPFTSEELSTGNLDRSTLIPLLDDSYQPGPELSRQLFKPPQSQGGNTESSAKPPHERPPPGKSFWVHFTCPPSSLSTLKSLTTASKHASTPFVSTDDAVSALIWQSVTGAHLPRLQPTTESTFGRAIDVRPYMDTIPKTYPGLMQSKTFNDATLPTLITSPLGVIASNLRSVINPATSNLQYQICALATLLTRSPNKNIASLTAKIDPSKDIMVSSWAKLNSYELDFGLGLGYPEAGAEAAFYAC